MSTFETLHAPSATFSSPFLTITYTPAGPAYTISPRLARTLAVLSPLIWAVLLLLLLVFASTTYHLHHRVKQLEASCSPTQCVSQHTRRVIAILQHTLHAHTLDHQRTSNESREHKAAMAHLGQDIEALDKDILALDRGFALHAGVLRTLEYNLEQARVLLGAGVELDVSDAGLDVGDDVQTFWAVDGLDCEAGDDDDDDVDELIDVTAGDELVCDWMDACADPDECYECWM